MKAFDALGGRFWHGGRGLPFLGLFFVLICCLSARSVSAAAPDVVWEACAAGSATGQECAIPRGVAVSPAKGRIFVADQGNRRIVEFTAWGEFVKAWGWDVVASGPDDDVSPSINEFEICRAAIDICKSGISGSGAGQFNGTQGIAVDSGGNVYLVDRNNHRVQKFDPEGHLLLMFGRQVNKSKVEGGGSTAEQNLCPITPTDICQGGLEGTGGGEFGAWAVGSFITIDRQGTPTVADDTVYVGDQNRVQVFDSGGIYSHDLLDPDGVLTGETVQSLATDPTDHSLYIALAGQPNVVKMATNGAKLCAMKVDRPSAIAADGEGRVWVASEHKDGTPAISMRIVQFNGAACSESSSASFDAELNGLTSSTGFATGLCAGSDPPGNFIVSNTGPSFVRAYGPGPLGCEPPPSKAPQITDQFATIANTDSAVVRAKVNPHFWQDTSYYVEYGLGACADDLCHSRSPASGKISLGGKPTQNSIVGPGAFLSGLKSNTTYHYRFIAESGGGGPEYGTRPAGMDGSEGEATVTTGLDATFHTPSRSPKPKSNCQNQEFRVGVSSFLADCRAFEMVSPVNKNGGGIEVLHAIGNGEAAPLAALDQASDKGNRITFSSKQAFSDAIGGPFSSQYLATRQSQEWSNHSLNPPNRNFPGGVENTALDTEYRAFSEDLSEAWIIHQAEPTLSPCAPPSSSVLYRRDNGNDSYEALHCKSNIPFYRAPAAIELLGVSADGCHAIFRSNSRLTDDAAGPFPGSPLEQPYQLYESSCDLAAQSEGALRLVSTLPDGSSCTLNSQAGSTLPPIGENDGRYRDVRYALSADAHRLYWSCGSTLYLRTDPSLDFEGDEQTVKIAGASGTAFEKKPPEFQGASPDGSRALITAYTDKATYRLQEYDATAAPSTLTVIADGIENVGGELLSLMGASDSLSRVYFASRDVLPSEPNSEGDVPTDGIPNLYFYERGVGYQFIGNLGDDEVVEGVSPSVEDLTSLSPLNEFPLNRTSRVTSDGGYLAFMSSARLTGFDNLDAQSGEADAEVFVYDAGLDGGSKRIICVSCNFTHVRPSGDKVGVSDRWAAAWIPGWQTQLYPSRPLSEDGRRLFFNSFEALVDRDTNGHQDVYEWEQVGGIGKAGEEECEELGAELFNEEASGCISLISSGQDPEDSEFIDADKDGSDVFIRTGQSLLKQDPGLTDIYDARINGGFPSPPAPEPPCEGEACQSPPPPPAFGTPASSATGPGNISSGAKSCPRGKRKIRRGGKARCVTKHRRGKQRARRARANRRAAG